MRKHAPALLQMNFEVARGWMLKIFHFLGRGKAIGRHLRPLLAPHLFVDPALPAPKVFPTTRGQIVSLQVRLGL